MFRKNILLTCSRGAWAVIIIYSFSQPLKRELTLCNSLSLLQAPGDVTCRIFTPIYLVNDNAGENIVSVSSWYC